MSSIYTSDPRVTWMPDGSALLPNGLVRDCGNGRFGHFDHLSHVTGEPGATGSDRDELIRFLIGDPQ